MGKPEDERKPEETRKPYEKPTVRELTLEQAKLKLLGHASMGDPGAKELIELIFPKQAPNSP